MSVQWYQIHVSQSVVPNVHARAIPFKTRQGQIQYQESIQTKELENNFDIKYIMM